MELDQNFDHNVSEEERKKRKNTKSKEETSEEKFMKIQISEEEKKNLHRVFNLFVGEAKFTSKKKKKDELNPQVRVFVKRKEDKEEKLLRWFDGNDVRRILAKLLTEKEYKDIKQHDIKIMIWEVDENLDEKVDSYEFELMYKKCIEDQTGLEAKNLFNLVQFLMFCKPPEDKDGNVKDIMEFNRTIKPEDTYSLIYGRLDRQYQDKLINRTLLELLDEEIMLIFKKKDDPEETTDYLTYLKRVYDHALNKRLKDKKKDKKKNK